MTDTPARQRAVSATLHDVAREAGVSLATASRVLNGSTRQVAPAYRERVETVAARLGYTANLSAQAIARGTSATIALLVADIADPYFGQIAAGVVRGADQAGMVVTVAMTDRDPQRELGLVRALRGQRPAGLILAASRTSADIEARLAAELELVTRAGGRVVGIGAPGGSMIRSVEVEHKGGAHEMGAALAARGYRHAVVLAAASGVLTSDARLDGFAEGFASGGGMIDRVYRGTFTRESGAAMMDEALTAGIEPGTLVFGLSDVIAIGALSALRVAGRQVGADIALCGFDDIATAVDVSPALTTVHVPLEEIGYQAFLAATDPRWAGIPGGLTLETRIRESTPANA